MIKVLLTALPILMLIGIGHAEPQAPNPVTWEELRQTLYGYYGWGKTYPKPLPPEVKILDKKKEKTYERWHIKYRVDANEYSYGYLLIPLPFPAKGKRLPLVMAPHPTSLIGKDRVLGIYAEPPADEKEVAERAARSYARDLVNDGFVVFAPDRAAYGERRLLKNGENYKAQMAAYSKYLHTFRPGWRLTAGKNVWDLQRALDFLVTYDFIDPKNIGTIGHSLGAWDSIMLIATDDRVKTAVVNSGGMLHYNAALWHDDKALRDYMNDPKQQTLSNITNIMFMLCAGRSLLYDFSTKDPYDRGGPNLVDNYRAVRKAFDEDEKKWGKTDFSFYIHSKGHDFPPEARALAYAWLKEKLRPEIP
jgi:hypothetical protein